MVKEMAFDFFEMDDDGDVEAEIGALQSVGALQHVGAMALQQLHAQSPAQFKNAVAKLKQKLSQAPAAALQNRFMNTMPETLRRSPAGFFGPTGSPFFSLGASIGATTLMTCKVQRPTHVDRLLIVPSDPGAIITSIKIGDIEQMLNSGGVPVELYGESAITDRLPDNFSPLGPGLDMYITLQNTTASAITGAIGFKAGVMR